MIKKIIKALWIFLAVVVLLCVGVFASISYGWIGYMPPVEELEIRSRDIFRRRKSTRNFLIKSEQPCLQQLY